MPHAEVMSELLSKSDCFALLAKRRRRRALRVLRESATPLSAIELAERIADEESDDPADGDRRAVHLTLYHNHLPLLEEFDVVEYDPDDGRVRLGSNFNYLIDALEGANEGGTSWSDE